MMLLSDSVGGADASRNGFSNRSPVNVTASWVPIVCLSGKGLYYTAFRWRAAPKRARFSAKSGPGSAALQGGGLGPTAWCGLKGAPCKEDQDIDRGRYAS
jgi:hypothetical protein